MCNYYTSIYINFYLIFWGNYIFKEIECVINTHVILLIIHLICVGDFFVFEMCLKLIENKGGRFNGDNRNY